ncbi:hypothetical protein SELMODRAFT_415908 [Selaginella moellendorffii]|uniref:Peptidase M50 domain-containing protein n=1 Tax=Selaginella moellendorffii TaxID=88036 RepID=D8RYK3_SELML|nr:hypothetical protein SELMODRAFT_415908 [Selaginella moellendorffii]
MDRLTRPVVNSDFTTEPHKKPKLCKDVFFPDRMSMEGLASSPRQTSRVKTRDLADATVQASREFWKLGSKVVEGLAQAVMKTADKLSGPVAIVAVGAEVVRLDVAGLFQFTALHNLNLAVVNILPLLALDGGYLFDRAQGCPTRQNRRSCRRDLTLGIVLMVWQTPRPLVSSAF